MKTVIDTENKQVTARKEGGLEDGGNRREGLRGTNLQLDNK